MINTTSQITIFANYCLLCCTNDDVYLQRKSDASFVLQTVNVRKDYCGYRKSSVSLS